MSDEGEEDGFGLSSDVHFNRQSKRCYSANFECRTQTPARQQSASVSLGTTSPSKQRAVDCEVKSDQGLRPNQASGKKESRIDKFDQNGTVNYSSCLDEAEDGDLADSPKKTFLNHFGPLGNSVKMIKVDNMDNDVVSLDRDRNDRFYTSDPLCLDFRQILNNTT